MTIRYLYIVEDDQTGERTAHPLMRGVKLQAAINNMNGKVWRVTIAAPPGRELYSALYNRDDSSLIDWTLVNLLEKGRLKKIADSAS